MELTGFKDESSLRKAGRKRLALLLSLTLHLSALLFLLAGSQRSSTIEIIAAGPGEGGEGGGGSIEVGVAGPSAILGFAKPKPVSYEGDQDSPINNARVETVRREADNPEEVLPSSDHDQPDPRALKTDKPVADQQERISTGKEERGRSDSSSALVGRSYGSPIPGMIGGVGFGTGGGYGAGTGLPGGSEYGRRIQMILSRNYNPPQVDASGSQLVIIILRIGRDGRILSIENGRVAPSYIKQRSALAQVNYAAERAVLASDPLPPFPAGFLSGIQEARAEIIFKYPK